MFTLEIGGKPVAVTDADEAQARAIFESDEFKQDLTAMTSQGARLWDGKAPLTIRPASLDEMAESQAADLDYDEDVGDEDEEGSLSVTFLVPVDHDHEDVSAIPPELKGRSH